MGIILEIPGQRENPRTFKDRGNHVLSTISLKDTNTKYMHAASKVSLFS